MEKLHIQALSLSSHSPKSTHHVVIGVKPLLTCLFFQGASDVDAKTCQHPPAGSKQSSTSTAAHLINCICPIPIALHHASSSSALSAQIEILASPTASKPIRQLRNYCPSSPHPPVAVHLSTHSLNAPPFKSSILKTPPLTKTQNSKLIHNAPRQRLPIQGPLPGQGRGFRHHGG